ncbi:hypothetical protein PINS_up009594 [Pythium insidiosum]|nr:hypothetical protein PINS_up009594 [Pythium insidiosum]
MDTVRRDSSPPDPPPPASSGGTEVAMPPVAPEDLTAPTLNFAGISTWKFRLAWLGILVLHALCAFYFIVNTHVYDRVPGSAVALTLEVYSVGMEMSSYPTIKGVHAFFAALHILLGAVMIVWSLWKRRVSFGPLQELVLDDTRSDSGRGSKVASSRRFSSLTSVMPTRVRESKRLKTIVSRGNDVVKLIFSRQGFFGVEGKYFDEILAVREVVESVLQANQAYRMSRFLPRPWLNRFYVGMLVVNCWMVPIIHYFCHRDLLLRRALSLLVDAILDFTSAMVVPTVLLFSYASSFDTAIWGFPYTLYYDDTWFVTFMSEFPIMIVTSWADLASRCVFSFGLISCIESTKELLREASPAQASANKGTKHRASLVSAKEQQQQQQQQQARLAIARRRPISKLRVVSSFRQLRSKPLRSALQSLQGLCALLGAVVIVLHLYAESAVNLDECVVQVHPWLETKPACVLLEWNCDTKHHTGEATGIAAQWSKSSPALVRRLLVRHCPELEVPTLITRFRQLEATKMYNTTIASWSVDAALTAIHHPNMFLAYFVRVNMSSSGKLPAGLATSPFPPRLLDIELGISNLNSLPDHLDTTWPSFMTFSCERCELTAIPKVLHNMHPYWIAIGNNPISSFPFEIFSIAGLEIMGLTGTSLLPLVAPSQNVSFLQDTTVRFLMLADSNVTWLPRWVDTFTALPRTLWFMPPLDLTATPLCDAITRMRGGTLDRFPVTWTANDELSEMMYVTTANVSVLDNLILCTALTTDAYPFAVDDSLYKLHTLT